MDDSVQYWIRSTYKNNEPAIVAMDELPATALKNAVKRLSRRWQKRFEELAPKLAKHYARRAADRSTRKLFEELRRAGFTVRFKMTRAMRDAMNATVSEQVGLIRSIPQHYFTEVEGLVMRAVSRGSDLAPLTKSLQKRYGVTKRRAASIARDQNNKMIATFTRTRQLEAGIEEAIWRHSHAGKEPRPTHLANDGKRYDIRKGWYDPDADGKGKGRWVHPGELINCRCFSEPVIAGFDD